MLTTLLVIGGILVGLLLLLALIVALSARPATPRGTPSAAPQGGHPHPDAWSRPAGTGVPGTVVPEITAVR